MMVIVRTLVERILHRDRSFPPNSTVKLVIGYEDFVTGQRAMRSCQYLIERLGHQFEVLTDLWKFDLLRMPRLRDIAAQDAAQADVVMISTHGCGELPSEVKSWITALSEADSCRKALVVLLDAEEQSTTEKSQVHSFLQRIAGDMDMDFFVQRSSVAKPQTDSARHSVATRVPLTSSGLEEALPTGAARDWGINE